MLLLQAMDSDETRQICVESVLEGIIATICLGKYGCETTKQQRRRDEDEDRKPEKIKEEDEEQAEEDETPFDLVNLVADVDDDDEEIERSQEAIRTMLESLVHDTDDDDEEDDYDAAAGQLNASLSSSQSTFASIFENSFNSSRHCSIVDLCPNATGSAVGPQSSVTGFADTCGGGGGGQRRATAPHVLEDQHCYQVGTFPRKENRRYVSQSDCELELVAVGTELKLLFVE